MTCEEVSSPFVSMPAIPAVYLTGDIDSQPLEKASIFGFLQTVITRTFILVWRYGIGQYRRHIFVNGTVRINNRLW